MSRPDPARGFDAPATDEIAPGVSIYHEPPPPKRPSPDALPPYLGLGWLDLASVSFADGLLAAEYRNRDELIYRVEWRELSCDLTEWDGERRFSLSHGQDLREAALLLGTTPREMSPVAVRLNRQASGLAWIQLTVDPEIRLAFFPAIEMFTVKVVDTYTTTDWRVTLGPPPGGPTRPVVTFEPERMLAGLVRRYLDGRTPPQPIYLRLYQAPAIFVEPLLRALIERGHTWWDIKPYRPVVEPAHLPRTTYRLFVGDPGGGLYTYAIVEANPESELTKAIRAATLALREWEPPPPGALGEPPPLGLDIRPDFS